MAPVLAYAVAIPVALAFLFPYAWMLSGAFRRTRDVMADPLRLWPEQLDLSVLGEIGRIGGAPLWGFVVNSLLYTTLATALGTMAAALGA